MTQNVQDAVLHILREKGPLETDKILKILENNNIVLQRKELNSMLYGVLRNFVTKDLDSRGQQIWKVTLQKFTATKGLEFSLYKELLNKKIITTEHSQLDYEITNRRNRKVYHLDIAIFVPSVIPTRRFEEPSPLVGKAGIHNPHRIPDPVRDDSKHSLRQLNIEVDGWDHMRADAMYSIQKQLRERGKHTEIEIDWMDHERSFIDFKTIDADAVYAWCMRNASWCRRFHEELLWPKDISRNLYLIENGWEIMRIWNFEVRDDLKRVVKEIEEWMI